MVTFTHDEWGKTVWHIQTGLQGMKMFQELGFTNEMSEEEYEKHMESHNRLRRAEDERIWEFFKNLF